MSHAFRVAQENAEDKAKRLQGNKLHKADRQEKLSRTRYGEAKNDVQLANMFKQFGIDYLNTPKDQIYDQLKARLDGKKLLLSSEAIEFLAEHYEDRIDLVKDFNGKTTVTFHEPKQQNKGEDSMSLLSDVAERSGQSRKIVRAVYEALCKTVRIALKNERRIRLPELAVIKVKFRPAREKRKAMNPFTKKMGWQKARPATNKVRFSPVKDLKVYVEEKVEVVAPKKKKSKKSKKEKK